MDGDRIDPARTKATIQRSLDKAKARKVDFYPVAGGDPLEEEDILMALRIRATEAVIMSVEFKLNQRAVKEIQRLRELVSYLTEERRRLRVEAGYD